MKTHAQAKVKNAQKHRYGTCILVFVLAIATVLLVAVACTNQSSVSIVQTSEVIRITKTADVQATQQARVVANKPIVITATPATRATLASTGKPTLAATAKPTLVAPASLTPTPTSQPTVMPTDEPTLEPTSTPEPTATRETIRPVTHIIKATGVQDAAGELIINNNSQYDGLAILATFDAPNSAIASGVIRNGESLTMAQIPDGVYRLYFCTGTDWLPEVNQFSMVVSYQSFEDSFEYTTSASEYTSWEVTLAFVADGNASSIPVSSQDFPSAN